MKRIIWSLLLIVSILHAFPLYAETTTVEVIPLKHRTVDQVMPVIQPFVDRQGAINGMNNQLIIRTTPANLRQIKQILQQIDIAPRRLLITVKQNAVRDADGSEAELSGSANLGDSARITVPGSRKDRGGTVELHQGENVARARVFGTRTMENAADTQQLQVLEGNQAFIRMGKSVPIPERTIVRNGQTVTVIEGSTYRDATTGFYVRPRISGDHVTLEVVPQRNTVDAQGRINIQEANTTVSGSLGEWIEVGGVGRSQSQESSGTVYSSSGSESDQRRVLIKVEEINATSGQ